MKEATLRLRLIALGIVLVVGACKKTTDTSVTIETAAVERRSIVLSAQANGTVEPIDMIEVKSKASGTIIKMPVDVGSKVRVGDLLVQIDPRTVQNAYTQAALTELMRLRAIDLASAGAEMKLDAQRAAKLRGNVTDSLKRN